MSETYAIAAGFVMPAHLTDASNWAFGSGIALGNKPFEPPKEFKFNWRGDDLPEFQFVFKDIDLETLLSFTMTFQLLEPKPAPRCLRPTPWSK